MTALCSELNLNAFGQCYMLFDMLHFVKNKGWSHAVEAALLWFFNDVWVVISVGLLAGA